MSNREKWLKENLDQALIHLEQACSAMNAAGLNHLWFTTKSVHAGVLQVRETMKAYPITREKQQELEDQASDLESAWVPARHPPAEGRRVLVMLTTGEVWAGHYDGENWTVHVMGACNSITHWMPIPKLPKDEL